MYKKILSLIVFLLLLVVFASTTHAALTKNEQLRLWPYRQFDSRWASETYAYCGTSSCNCGTTIRSCGCSVTSLSMLLTYWGLGYMYKEGWPYCEIDASKSTNPSNLNTWMRNNSGYDKNSNIDWLSMKKFYYCGLYGYFWQYMRPYRSCSSSNLKGDCFKPANPTNSTELEKLLDYDISGKRPDIAKIQKSTGGKHFVVIGGYCADPRNKNPEDNVKPGYTIYDPGKSYDSTKDTIVCNPDTTSTSQSNPYQPYPLLRQLYPGSKIIQIYRYQGILTNFLVPTMGYAYFWDMSPIEYQIINSEGLITGYDPDTGGRVENIYGANYSEESIDALDSEEPPSEPSHVLMIDNPSSGNYIIRVFGMGDGPYTIMRKGMTDSGTDIPATALVTGTAYQGMVETYRIQYSSSTGEATLSTSNQSPTANAGTDQTGEQSYEITLDGSRSYDPDGDPLKYTWSFVSKPSGSMALLSNSSSKTPTFIPDLPGTYILQLIVNDYFTDSSPSTVTITVTSIQSRISGTPNFSTPLNTGSSSISFDMNNIGRINVSSGLIDMTLKDPDGNVISTGSQTFSLSVGQSATLNIPVTIPSLKFGNYSLIYTQSDETKTGSQTTTSIANSVSAAFTYDETSYKVRETANLTLDLTNTGKFNLDKVTVSVTSVSYTDIKTVNIGQGQAQSLQYAIQIPETINAGQHTVNVTLTLPSGSSTTQNSKLTIPDSSLVIKYSGPTTITAGDMLNLTIENTGGVDTSYTTEKLTITDSKGITIYEGNPTGAIQAGQVKTLADIQVPSNTVDGSVSFNVKVKDSKTGNFASFSKPLDVTGLTSALQTQTDKSVYLKTEAITGLTNIANGGFGIESGSLKITVNRTKSTGTWQFTKWGSYGSGDGQFNSPSQLFIYGQRLYVADGGNSRIQVFDLNGNFLLKFGSKGTGNGQFQGLSDIWVHDSKIYTTDSLSTYRGRIQRFDLNGNYEATIRSGELDGYFPIAIEGTRIYYTLGYTTVYSCNLDGTGGASFYPGFDNVSTDLFAKDGKLYCLLSHSETKHGFLVYNIPSGTLVYSKIARGSGDGQFSFPNAILVTEGNIFVADRNNNRIQVFDLAGNFISKFGSYGTGDGQFKYPYGIAVAQDGSIYVADTGNNRIQRITPPGNIIEKFFETTIPITQSANTTQDYTTNIGTLNTTGKLYLDAELKNSLGQTIATSEYPFYIVEGNTVLSFSADKKIYKPNETVTITGKVENRASITASGLNLSLSSQKSGASSQNLYSKTFDLAANSSYPFTITTTASTEGTYTLTGKVTQNNSTLVEIADQYEVASPKVTATVTVPDVVGNEAFDINVEMKNDSKVEVTLQFSVLSSQFSDNQQITIPAGEAKTFQYNQQINQNTTYTFTFTGDLNQTITKTIAYGLGASVSVSASGVYPEGKISIPVTITNIGLLDETLTVAFSVQPSAISQNKSYFIPKGLSTTDTLYYDLTEGSYQLSAVSYQPSATTSTSFSVKKENKVDMIVSAGTQTNSLIPVTVALTNKGYNDITGSIAVSVINNEEKVIWRGEAEVTALKSQTSSNYTINVNTFGITSGAYKTGIVLYSSSGQQLATTETQIRVLGPIFEITSLPDYPAFTAGKEATLSFTVKNTGTLEGTTSFSVKAMDVLNQSITESLKSGEEKSFTFNFTVPEDSEEKDYSADYTLTPVNSQGTSGQVKFHVNQINVEVTASLDKEAYKDGDTALVTLNISRVSQTEDGTYLAVVRYRSNPAIQSFMLTSQPTTITFSVPLSDITGEDIFYSVHFEGGNTIYQNTMAINTSQPDLVASSQQPVASIGKDNTMQLTATITNQGKTASESTTISIYDSDSLIETKAINALNSGESQEITFIYNVLGKAGDHTIKAVVDPDNTVTEFNEENNTAETSITVPDINLITETDKDTYKIRQKVNINSTIKNLTAAKTYQNLTITTSAKDPSGNEVYNKSATIETIQPANSTTHTETWSTTGLSNEGTYTITQKLFREGDPEGRPYIQNLKLITLEKAPDFTLSLDIDHQKIKQGERATYTAYLEAINGWASDVTLNIEGLPQGTSVSFSPGKLVPPGESITVIITTDTTTAGTYNLNLTAEGIDEGETVTHTLPLTLDVSGFSLSAEQPTQTIKQLETATFEININSLNGYEGEINLSIEGAPNGVKASLGDSPDSTALQAGKSGTVPVTVQTSKYAKIGTYTLTVTGDDGLIKHTLDLSLILNLNPDIAAGIITAQGPGPNNTAEIKVFNSNLQTVLDIAAFDTKYGAYVIGADIDGDGYDEIIVSEGPDPKNTATLRVFKRNGTFIAEHTAFETNYGLTLSSGDIDGDWKDELIVGIGPDPKNPATLKILKYNGTGFTELMTQTVFDTKYGLNTTTGDIDGDGISEIITAAGPGSNNPAIIKIWKLNGTNLSETGSFTAFDGSYGANIAAGDIDGDGKAEIIAGAGPDPKNPAIVRIFKADGALISEIRPYDTKHDYGVFVSAADINGDGKDEIITGLGPGPQNPAWVKVFRYDGSEIYSFISYPDSVKYGVKVSKGNIGD